MSRAASSRQFRRYLGGVVIAIVMGALVAACGGGGSSSSSTSSSSTTAEGQSEVTTASSRNLTTPASEIPEEATIAFSAAPTTLDPDLGVGQTDVNALNLIAGLLYELDAEGAPTPALAESAKTSADGLKWTFTLQPGLVFSDGSKLTANDVSATFERAINDPSNVVAGLFAPIKNVEASGARTVIFNLNQPYSDLPGLLAEEETMIMPAAKLKEKDFFNKPISAGPYILTSWEGGTETFEVNPNYFGPKPAVKKLKFVTVEDANSRLSQLKSGQIDFAFDLPPAFLPTLESSSDISAAVVPAYGWYSIDMWNKTAPLNDSKVRRAISLAIDREQLADVIWQGQNAPVSGFWPPTMAGYDASTEHPTADVEGAKKLLAGTECENGCTIKFEYPPALVPFADQMALLISSDLEEIGIKLKLTKVDFNTFYADLGEGTYQMALYGLYSFANQPTGLVTYGLAPEGGLNANFSGYSSPAMTKMISKTLTTSGSEQAAGIKEVNEQFAKDQPYVTLATWAYMPATRLPVDVMSVEASGLLHVGTTE